MRKHFVAGLACVAAVACAELAAPPYPTVSFSIVPVFGRYATFADDADQLRIVIFRDSSGTFIQVSQVVVSIDPITGTADTSLSLVLLTSPQLFRFVLEAVRSSDGVVLFTGQVEQSVSAGQTATEPLEVALAYVGPTAARVTIAPQDTAVQAGASFAFRAAAYDGSGNAVGVPLRFLLADPGDTLLLRVDRLSGGAVAATGVQGLVRVLAATPDTAVSDTARVLIGAVPVGVVATPGYGNVAAGATLAFTATAVDALGNSIPTVGITWTSRNTDVVSVSGSGVATGVAAGTAVLVAAAPTLGFADSVLVTVPTSGNVVVSSVSNQRAFRTAAVNDTIVVTVAADMTFTPSERLGSYNATLAWNPAVLQYLDVQAGDFPMPEVNAGNASSGQLRFAQANAAGTAGVVALARVRFRAIALGSTVPAVSITEMSAAQTFTNLITRVTVTNGTVTVK